MRLGRPIVAVAAALTLTAGAARADPEDAGSFVRSLYGAYAVGDPDYLGRAAAHVFAPALLKLIRQDAASTRPSDVGVLDWDPVCGCQDPDGLTLQSLSLSGPRAGPVMAAVRLRFGQNRLDLKLRLVREREGWRIADIYNEGGGLEAALRKGLAEESRLGGK